MRNKIVIKNIILTLLLMALYSFNSCEDFLTKTPPDKLSDAGYWKDENEVNKWMSGVYKGVNTALMARITFWGDGRTDNVFPTGYSNGDYYQFNAIPATVTQTDWSDLYAVINRCNMAIENVSRISSMDIVAKNSQLGQCFGIRALMYFYILRLWGDAPLILQSWDGSYETKYNGRTSVAEIGKQVEKDIDTAIGLLGNTGVFYFNTGAALALKMDFLAWNNRYSEIPAVFNQLKSLGLYSLVTNPRDWNKIFSDPASSKETIFSLHWSNEQNNTDRSPYAPVVTNITGHTAFTLPSTMYHLMIRDTLDIRFWGVIARNELKGKLIPENAPIYQDRNIDTENMYKFFDLGTERGTFLTNVTEWPFKPPIYRYADVLLLYAEALNRTGNGQEAINIVNNVRVSRGSTVLASLNDYTEQLGGSSASREKLILDERQLEFYKEGKRWFDLLRMEWGMEVLNQHVRYLQDAKGTGEVTGFTDSNFLLWPIHQNVITSNQNIKQNIGY